MEVLQRDYQPEFLLARLQKAQRSGPLDQLQDFRNQRIERIS
jgi:hypothetical protein